MRSLWLETSPKLPRFPALDQDKETEVLIIGGGMAGVLCAYFLHQAGVDYLLLEAETVGSGITQNTTAKLTSQHGLLYHQLKRVHGLEAARSYLEANQAALAQYRHLCQEMDCDFQEQDAYVYSLDRRDKLEQELDTLRALDFPAELALQLPLPFPVAGAVRFPHQAQFHPLKFRAALSKDLHILEHSKVLELRPGAATTHQGVVRAKKIIVTTHFPFLNKHGSYFLKLYQHRSYVLALQGAPSFPGMYVDEAQDGLSFRHWGNLLLLGGGGHRSGKQGGGWAQLTSVAQRHFPQAKEVYRWATQDCMPLDHLPYIGPYSRHTPALFVATGFQKWGMTSSMVAARVLTDLVQGKDNPYAALFSPSRSMLHPQLACNALEASANLLTPTVPRCPHRGCALKYNPQEHSWECPCHGSRFSQAGKLLDNPATGDLRRQPPPQ